MMLHCQTWGEPVRSAVVLLHGFMGSGDDWRDVGRALEDRFYVVAPDLPGHGNSRLAPQAGDLTMASVCAQLDATLDEIGIARCALVGYSMGGRIALHYALRYAARCARLVLESATPGLRLQEEREARVRSDAAWAERLLDEDRTTFLRQWYEQAVFGSLARRPDLLKRMIEKREDLHAAQLSVVLRSLGTGRQQALWDRLGELEMPALAIAGAMDGKYVEIATEMSVSAPNIRAQIIPGAGHVVHLEQLGAFLQSLGAFLKYLS